MKKCFVSIVTNYYYLDGLKVLATSLAKSKTRYPLVVVIPDDLDDNFKDACKNVKHVFDVIKLPRLDFGDLKYDDNPSFDHLKDTFFKLAVASLTQFEKIILLDTDLLILKNIDSIFEYPHMSATRCGSIGHPEWTGVLLNSGLLVLEPNNSLYKSLVDTAKGIIANNKDNGPIGDQDVFCALYPDWNDCEELQIPEQYNEYYLYAGKLAKTLKHKWNDIFVLHFWGKIKPWSSTPKELLIQAMRHTKNRRIDLARCAMLYRRFLISSKKENR